MGAFKNLCSTPTYAKDKGYAWVVLVLSFISHTIHIGFTYAVVGNLTIAHKNFFGISLQESSFIGSMHITVLCVFGWYTVFLFIVSLILFILLLTFARDCWFLIEKLKTDEQDV